MLRSTVQLASRRTPLTTLIALAPTALAAAAGAATLNVPAAFPTIQSAINAAAPGDIVVVANGTYHERIDFLGKNITVRSATPADPSLTTIDADLLGTAVTMNGVGASAKLSGFTILEGDATTGGGADINGNPTIKNCRFELCDATSGAGAFVSGDAIFQECEFVSNSATGGGAIEASGNITIENCHFELNHATVGGALSLLGDATVTNCTFLDNDATNASSVMVNGGLAAFDRCTFDDGDSTCIYVYTALALSNSVILNTTTAISTNSTLNPVSVVIGNSTIANEGTNGISLGDYGHNTSLVVRNSIIGTSTNSIVSVGTGSSTETISVEYSDVEGGWAGTGNINAEPDFVDLAAGDVRLRRGSPCVDAGNNAAVPAFLTLDRNSDARFINDPGAVDTGAGASPIVDMGAYERPNLTRYVNVAATGLNDGSSWADAYVDLRDALSDAWLGGVDYIMVAKGVYQPDAGTGARNMTFQLADGTWVRGGFSGTETELSESDSALNVTTLSGAIGGPGTADNSYHVVLADGVGASTRLEGFVIQKGFADGVPAMLQDRGAGILVVNSAPVIRDCWIRQNEAAGSGGGVYGFFSAAGMYDCRLNLNVAGGNGSAIACWEGSPVIANSLVHGNDHAGDGAISLVTNSNALIVNTTIVDNISSASGNGGLYVGPTATAVLRNDILWKNQGTFGAIEARQLAGGGVVDIAATTLQGWSGFFGGVGNNGADPLFVDPIGPDLTRGTGDDDYTLRPISPAIDNAFSDWLPEASFPTDLFGGDRFVDHLPAPNMGTGAYTYLDRGCFEFQGSPCPSDLNADGTTDAADLAILLGAWGTANPVADLNGSGMVDAADLAILLGSFGPC
jgi:predicted outer membrane repeat protein